MARAKVAIAGIFCLLAVASCSSAASGGQEGSGHRVNWHQKGYQFARQSVAKGEPTDNAAAFAKAGEANQLSWCNDAYAPIFGPHAPVRKEYEGVATNAPPRGERMTKASEEAYSEWLSGCVAGLSGAKS